MTELHEMDAHQLSAALNSQEVSCVEVAQHFLDRISSDSHGAFITVTADSALAQAAAVDATAITERPTFAGVPMAIKDLTPTAGVRTTMGSVIMAENVATQDAWVVELAQQAGFISLGKTNTPEFGLSSYTDNDLIGPAKAPADPSRNAGGSSGGAAAAVGAGLVPLALGSDGGGSIRIPASCCGVVGFKASRGRISPGPESPAWTGLATEGALTRTVRDAALMLDVLARPMPGDSRTWPKPPEPFSLALREDPEPLMIASWSKPYLDFVEASPASLAALAHARER
ncbi:MAG: amidase, partial [Actinomycetales bacterium]|nr:amidase [Actinomycetales bacterium]